MYRRYGADGSLQQLHDQAIAACTRLEIERAGARQVQEVEDYTHERTLSRAARERVAKEEALAHRLAADTQRRKAELSAAAERRAFERDQRDQDLAQEARLTAQQKALEREHLAELARLGVDLTALLTAGSPNRVIELRGGAGAPHLHLEG